MLRKIESLREKQRESLRENGEALNEVKFYKSKQILQILSVLWDI